MHTAIEPGPSITRALGADNEWLCDLLEQTIFALAGGVSALHVKSLGALVHGLQRHLHVDNDLLLPELERRGEAVGGLMPHELRREHEELAREVDRLHACVEEAVDEDLCAELERLRVLLREHARLEQEAVYPACDRLLDSEVRAAAVRELDRKLVTRPPASCRVPERRYP